MKRLVCLLLFSLPLFARSPEEVLAAARAEGLPVLSLEDRLREGRAKGIEDPILVAALERRSALLIQSRELLRNQNYPLDAPPVQELWVTLARVLEGGMSEEHAVAVLDAAAGSFAGRVSTALEAGESMRLGGVDAETSSRIMRGFIEKEWSRPEILRAARTARQLASAGNSGPDIEQRLQRSSSGPGGPGGKRHRAGHGPTSSPEP
jgi:hypothetical protein